MNTKQIASLMLLIVALALGCSDSERLEGERLELSKNTWVPVTTASEPMQVKFNGTYGEGLFALSCKKSNAEEDESGAWSNVSGRMGETLEFGTSITRFEYDEYGNRSVASYESTLFFRFKILAYDESIEVATVLVLPPEEDSSLNN